MPQQILKCKYYDQTWKVQPKTMVAKGTQNKEAHNRNLPKEFKRKNKEMKEIDDKEEGE